MPYNRAMSENASSPQPWLAAAMDTLLGAIVASRAEQGVQAFAHWREQAHHSAGLALSEYLTHEAALLANRSQVDDFIAGVHALNERLDRLESRIEAGLRPLEPHN